MKKTFTFTFHSEIFAEGDSYHINTRIVDNEKEIENYTVAITDEQRAALLDGGDISLFLPEDYWAEETEGDVNYLGGYCYHDVPAANPFSNIFICGIAN